MTPRWSICTSHLAGLCPAHLTATDSGECLKCAFGFPPAQYSIGDESECAICHHADRGGVERFIAGAVLALALALAVPADAGTREQADEIVGRRGLSKVEVVLPVACQLADAGSTLDALSRPGTREGNPAMAQLTGRPVVFMAVKAGVGVGFAILAQKLAKDGHRGWARFVSWGTSVAGCAAAANNMRVAR